MYRNNTSHTESRGFTLIELLVVIAIIGLLSSVVLASLNNARKKGRDAARIATMRSIQTALELYYSSNGSYPNYTEDECGGTEGYTTSNNNFMSALVSGGQLSTYPTDPAGTNCNLQYAPVSSNQSYILFYHLETQSPPAGQTCYNPAYWFCIVP